MIDNNLQQVIVGCENSRTDVWEFYRHKNEEDYGNGTYITVIRNNELEAYVDMRYTKYEYISWIISYIRMYYGEKILTFEISPIEIPF